MNSIFILTVMALCISTNSWAQDSLTAPKADYTLSLYGGGGYVYDITEFNPATTSLSANRNQGMAYGRVMWKPDNLLSLGVDVGYYGLYTVSNDSVFGQSVRSAVPFSIVVSMQVIENMEAFFCMGYANVTSTVEGGNGKVAVSALSGARIAGLSYVFPIDGGIMAGLEGRYTSFDHNNDKLISIGIVLRYDLLKY